MVQVSDAKLTLLLLFHFVCYLVVFSVSRCSLLLFKCGCCRSHVYLSDKNLHFLRLHLLCIYDDDDYGSHNYSISIVTIFAATHSDTPSPSDLSSNIVVLWLCQANMKFVTGTNWNQNQKVEKFMQNLINF